MKRATLNSVAIFLALFMVKTCNAQTTHQATLTWTASLSPGVTYNVLRSSTAGGTKTTIKSGLSVLTYVDTPLPANTQECYQVTASSPGLLDSTPTNEVCVSTGKDQASPPGALTVVAQ